MSRKTKEKIFFKWIIRGITAKEKNGSFKKKNTYCMLAFQKLTFVFKTNRKKLNRQMIKRGNKNEQ